MNFHRRILTLYQMYRYQTRNIPGELDQDHYTMVYGIYLLAPGRSGSKFKSVIFEHMLRIMNISCESALNWMQRNTFYDNLTLVHVMAPYREATKHYMGQCWPRSMLRCDVTGPHRVDYERWTGPSISQKNVPITCMVSVSSDDITYKDIHMVPKIARSLFYKQCHTITLVLASWSWQSLWSSVSCFQCNLDKELVSLILARTKARHRLCVMDIVSVVSVTHGYRSHPLSFI